MNTYSILIFTKQYFDFNNKMYLLQQPWYSFVPAAVCSNVVLGAFWPTSQAKCFHSTTWVVSEWKLPSIDCTQKQLWDYIIWPMDQSKQDASRMNSLHATKLRMPLHIQNNLDLDPIGRSAKSGPKIILLSSFTIHKVHIVHINCTRKISVCNNLTCTNFNFKK